MKTQIKSCKIAKVNLYKKNTQISVINSKCIDHEFIRKKTSWQKHQTFNKLFALYTKSSSDETDSENENCFGVRLLLVSFFYLLFRFFGLIAGVDCARGGHSVSKPQFLEKIGRSLRLCWRLLRYRFRIRRVEEEGWNSGVLLKIFVCRHMGDFRWEGEVSTGRQHRFTVGRFGDVFVVQRGIVVRLPRYADGCGRFPSFPRI